MERLVTTNEAAKILNLSVQGIHYRIKKGQLRSIKKDNRVYVYLNESQTQSQTTTLPTKEESSFVEKNYEKIIQLKDEQLQDLKHSMKWMKKQYKSEIHRIEKNQQQIVQVFNREIKLLQQAFNEMRSIYKIEHKPQNTSEEKKIEFISIAQFFVLMKKHYQYNNEIKNLILKRIKMGDKRFIYDNENKQLHIIKSDFSDLY